MTTKPNEPPKVPTMFKLSLPDLFWLVLVCAASLTHAEEIDKGFARPFPVVAYSKAHAKELKPFAEEVSQLAGGKLVMEQEVNPVCCVWLELIGTPSPGEPGYVIVHQGGGTVIQASNVEQLKTALKKWKSTAKETKNGFVFPVGLTTSHKVIK